MLLGASVISTTNNIPFLASSTLMSNKLKMVLNLPDQEAYIGLLDITVPICKVAGHLALYINQFPECAAKSNIWGVYHKMCHDPDLDSDLLFVNADGSSKPKFVDHDHCADEQGPSSTMAVQLEEDGRNSETCRDATSKSHGASSEISDPSEKVADVPGPNGHGGNRSHRAKGQGTMQTRDDAALRQQARQFRQVPPLREEVGVVPRGRKVERSTYAKAALAAIAIVLNGIYVPGEGRRPTWALTAMPLTPTARASIPTSKSYASSPSPSPLPLQDQATDKRASKKGARPKASTKRPSATRDGEVEELSDESSEYDWELLNK